MFNIDKKREMREEIKQLKGDVFALTRTLDRYIDRVNKLNLENKMLREQRVIERDEVLKLREKIEALEKEKKELEDYFKMERLFD